MVQVEQLAERVGLLQAAEWAAQQPAHLVQTARPALRRAIHRCAEKQASSPEPGQSPNAYTWREWRLEYRQKGVMDPFYAKYLRWCVHFGFQVCHRSNDVCCRNTTHAASVEAVIAAAKEIKAELEKAAERIAADAAALRPIMIGEYERLRDLYTSIVNTAYHHYQINLSLDLGYIGY